MDNNVMDAQPSDFDGPELEMLDTFGTRAQYDVYAIPKKSGGKRIIEAPHEDLKKAQRESLKRMQRIFMNMAAANEALGQYDEDVREMLSDSEMSKEEQEKVREDAKEKLSDARS
jgi:hypothetical protein